MERIIHDLVQGSEEWHQFRLDHFGASEAAAMLGLSKKVTRTELLRAKHTGIAKEYSDWVQDNILDEGHRVEAMARPIVERDIGQPLFPGTFSLGSLSASVDGITMDDEIAFEHKQWNEALARAISENWLPDEYMPQAQQILMVTGAKCLVFVCSDGTETRRATIIVRPDPEWQKRITDGWAQFKKDLDNYQHVEVAEQPVARSIDDLPALNVELTGMVVYSNLDDWQASVTERIKAINTDLQTDQDFADSQKMVNFLEKGEKTLELVKAQALSQTASIDELFRAIDSVRGEMRTKRLELTSLVTRRKDQIRADIQRRGEDAVCGYVEKLDEALGSKYLIAGLMPKIQYADFAKVMRGLKTFASLNNAVDTELANGKILADNMAKRIDANMRLLSEVDEVHKGLFADIRTICTKENEDFFALVKVRIAEHKEREAAKVEREAAQAQAAQLAEQQEQKAAAPAVFDLPTTKAPVEADTGKTIKLGQIAERLGFSVPAEFLTGLGINPVGKERAAVLYRESDFIVICDAIIQHVVDVRDGMAQRKVT